MFVNKFHETGDYFSKNIYLFWRGWKPDIWLGTIEGKRVYFKEDGYQVRNDRHKIGDFDYFFKKTVVCFLMILTATTNTIMLIRTVIYSSGGLITIMKPTTLAHHGELKTEHIYKISMKRPIFWVLKDDL